MERFLSPATANKITVQKPECQRARKAAWQRYKLKYDDDYRTQQHLSQQKWLQTNPGTIDHIVAVIPIKFKEIGHFKHIRNRRKRHCHSRKNLADNALIAKMDARKFCHFNMVGQFYLVPVIAKMDVSKVNIYTYPIVTSDCKDGLQHNVTIACYAGRKTL